MRPSGSAIAVSVVALLVANARLSAPVAVLVELSLRAMLGDTSREIRQPSSPRPKTALPMQRSEPRLRDPFLKVSLIYQSDEKAEIFARIHLMTLSSSEVTKVMSHFFPFL